MTARPTIAATVAQLADGNFTPELQTSCVLGLCEAQIDSALQESNQAVDSLVKAFTSIVEATRSVGALAEALPPDVRAAHAADLDERVAAIAQQVSAAVMAFQFYDKLTQRLGHVRYSLSTLALFVCDRTQANQPEQWSHLLTTLRRLYRTEDERQIFQAIMDGVPHEGPEAVPTIDETKGGEVELF